ncbi:MAG: hypothetical protein V4696_04705 [Pseudomonadota bacterium]
MSSNFTLSDSRDRARSVAATAAIHFALGVALLTGLAMKADRRADDGLKTFDVESPPPIPPRVELAPSPERRAEPAPPGRMAEPSPLVAPPAKLPTVQPIAAAPLAGRDFSATSGSALSGAGTGSGGTGVGVDGSARSIGTEARLLSGNRGRVPRELLRAFDQNEGLAHLLLTIGESGGVTGCLVIQGTGSSAVDQALCQIMLRQSRWSPALDREGRPISVQLRYTSIWRK